MNTDTLTNEQHSKTEDLTWGVIELQVTDLDRAVNFWMTALGLRARGEVGSSIALGTQNKTLFVLHPGATQAVHPKYLGMYHVALGVPDQQEFSRMLARLTQLRIRVSPIDHLGAKSMYIADPDGLEIEITFETPERVGRLGGENDIAVLYDIDGNPHSGRAPLDIPAELAIAQNADLQAPLSNASYLAHMHFRVTNLESAAAWFEGIGFTRNLMLPSFGMADMRSGPEHTHRIAMNVWSGPNNPPAPSDMARLVRYELKVHEPEIMKSATGLELSNNGLTGTDPTGTKISLVPAF